MKPLAALLLLLGVIRHLGYGVLQPELQALAWNTSGSILIAALLVLVWWTYRGYLLGSVVLWMLYEEALVGLCSTWRMIDWWPVQPGEEQCTARLGPRLTSFSLVMIGALIARVSDERRSDR